VYTRPSVFGAEGRSTVGFMFGRSRNANDNSEFEALLEENLTGMYRMALRLCRNASSAEDLVHDTVVRALRFRDKYELGTHFRAWIYTVLHHTFVHRYRRSKREREILTGSTRSDVQEQMTSVETQRTAVAPENAYLEHMLSDDIVHALDDLPDDFRAVVTLCDLEGLSYKEISDVVDCPVGTVMSRLYRGRRLLERRLRSVAVARGIVKDSDPQADALRENDGVVDIARYRRRSAGA